MRALKVIGLVFIFVLLFLIKPLGANAETIVYSTGFENNNGNYTHDGNVNWEWGTPSNVGPNACNSGSKCWGTDMDANVDGGTEGYLYSPDIAVPSLGSGQRAHVSFYLYSSVNTMTARGEFFTSANGSAWASKAQFFETMAGGWQHYEFDVSSYAGGNLYLKWRLYLPSGYGNVPGIYLDDIAVTIYDSAGAAPVFSLEAWEDPSSSASCPWVFPWNGSEYMQDNDIYSVARGEDSKQRDSYLLQKPLALDANGQYKLQIKEVDSEDSFTDFVQLKAVDHDANVKVAPDANGNIFAYEPAKLIAPVSAVAANGSDVLDQLNTENNSGYQAYSDDYIDVNFGNINTSEGARLFLRIKGFNWGEGVEKPYTAEPAVIVKVQDKDGNWNEAGRLKPRFDWSEGVFDLSSYWPDAAGQHKIRLYSVSHSIKYHEIDYVAVSAGIQPAIEIHNLNLNGADKSGTDVKNQLAAADNNYVTMSTGDNFSMVFDDAAQTLASRDFIFVSEGYYIPKSDTFFIYTYDGSNWVLRDGSSFSGSDSTKTFDLSGYLPDPQGEYKIRVWQDYKYESAGIDYAGLSVGQTAGILATSTDLRTGADILSLVRNSDNTRLTYGGEIQRNRWTEYNFTGLGTNTPPSVTTSVTGNQISWTYTDTDGNTPDEVQVQVQVWTGPRGTGDNKWNANLTIDPSEPIDYNGDPLTLDDTYYARLKAFDGAAWGGWNESSFVASTSTPKITLSAASSLATSTATISGNITATGGENPDVTVYWGTTNHAGTATGWDHSEDLGTQGVAVFSRSLSNLTPGTTYYFTAKAANSAGASWPAASLNFVTIPGYRVANLPSGVAAVLNETDTDVSDNSENYQTGAKTIIVKHSGSSLAQLTINFSANLDWTEFLGDSDSANHKSFINLSDIGGVTGTHTLYVPGTSSSYSVRVCPNATSLEEVTTACADGYNLTNGGSNGSVSASFSGGYWIITGLTGSGGMEIVPASQVVSVSSGGGGLPPEAYDKPFAPVGGFGLIINNGASVANDRVVSLKLNAGSNVKKMAISMTSDFAGVAQEDYQPAKQWDLCPGPGGFIKNLTCPDGTYTVYAKFYTAWGQTSDAVSASVILDPQAKINNLPANQFLILDRGTVYLILRGKKYGFVSKKAFLGLGYSFKNLIESNTASYPDGGTILSDPAQPHILGSWLLNGKTVYFVVEDGLIPVSSWDVFLFNGGKQSYLVKANAQDLKKPLLDLMKKNDMRIK